MLERPLALSADDPLRLRIVIDGSAIVAYVNDVIALSARGYDHTSGQLGLFVAEGGARFTEVSVSGMK